MNKSILGGLTMIGMVALAPLAYADGNKPNPRIMSLIGTGKITAEPDMAIVTIGVVREAKTARAALTANNQAMSKVVAVVQGAGVVAKDIQTSGFSINPKYHYPKRSSTGERPAPKITGYTVNNNLSVKVRDLDKLGSLLDSVVGAGSNQISGISFGLAKPRPLKNEARKSATANAIAKAELYAQAARLQLGAILSIREQPRNTFVKQGMANVRAMAVDTAESVPIARGEQAITMQVHITWEIQ